MKKSGMFDEAVVEEVGGGIPRHEDEHFTQIGKESSSQGAPSTPSFARCSRLQKTPGVGAALTLLRREPLPLKCFENHRCPVEGKQP